MAGADPQRARRWTLAALATLGCGWVAVLTSRLAGQELDDFFITYRYAWNLAHGNGLVFNLGERVYGLTCPLFGVLLGALSLGRDVPAIATALYGLSLLGVALLLARESWHDGPAFAVGSAIWITGSAFLWRSHGSEVAPALLLILIAADLAARRPALAGLLLALASGFRPEASLATGVVALAVGLEQRRWPWRLLASAAVGGVSIAGAFWIYFGQPYPVTLASKRALATALEQGSIAGRHFWPAAFEVWSRDLGGFAGPVAVVGLCGILLAVIRGPRVQRVLAGYAVVLLVAYPLLGIPYFTWYVVPVAVAVLHGTAILSAELWRRGRAALASRGVALRRIGAGVGGALLGALALAVVSLNVVAVKAMDIDPRMVAYRDAALWLKANTEPEEDVAYVEVGALGYYSQRPVRDLLGLITPSSLEFVERADLVGAFLAKPTRYVLFHDRRGRMRGLVEQPWFDRAYREVNAYDLANQGGTVHIYRLVHPRRLPAPRGAAQHPAER